MDFDLILAGGGLHNGLIALRLAQLRPDLRVAIVESGPSVGGNHRWSSFAHDVSPEQAAWTAPLMTHEWAEYSIRFPTHGRTIPAGYRSATSERLDAAVRAALPAAHILTGCPVVALDATSVTLADQRVLSAGAVIDGRGQGPTKALDLRWQKFLGLEVELADPHGLAGPIIMDATIPQLDGYRFIYTLPLGPTRLLIEDTYYSDGSDLAPGTLRGHIADYAVAQGWDIVAVDREESGILPIALGGDVEAFWDEGEAGVPRVGLRAAMFNPITGYSFPDAVRTADLVAALPDLAPATIYRALRDNSAAAWRQRKLYRMLNRMLFLAAHDDERRNIMQRFYTLNDRLVGRFYAARSTLGDWARILTGTPPIPIPRAVATLVKYEMDHR
jgi:lycopene beta-cyclase